MVPVVPSLAWAAVLARGARAPGGDRARARSRRWRSACVLVARGGTAGRHVGADRAALVEAARPVLAGFHRVAALDVGWVGAATEADVVDLAGVTDPAIAALPGGHTSKRVDARLLLDRQADALLLYLPTGLPSDDLAAGAKRPTRASSRRASRRTTSSPATSTPTTWLPLGARGAGYVLLRARPAE